MSVGGTSQAVALNAGVPHAAAPVPAVTAAPVAPTSSGPAAWNDEWMNRFVAAGADSQTLQILLVTGGDGRDEQGLAQLLTQVEQQHQQVMAQFAAQFPGELETLQKTSNMSITKIADLATHAVNGDVDKRHVLAKVDEAYGASGAGFGRSIVGDMLPYSIIPGWGAISTAIGLGNGAINGDLTTSRNPFSKRQLFGTGFDMALTPLMAAFGGATLYNLYQEQSHLRAGHTAALQAGSAEARIAALNGVNITDKRPINPFARDNRIIAALGKYQDVRRGVEHLEAVRDARLAIGHSMAEIGDQAERGRAFLTRWETGQLPVMSDTVMAKTKMGIFPQARGMLMQRGKESIALRNGAALLETRASGPILAAHGAAVDVQLAKPGEIRGVRGLDTAGLKAYSDGLLARSTNDLMTSTRSSAALVQQPGAVRKAFGAIKPNALDDAFKSVRRLETGKLGVPGGLAGKSLGTKIGLIGGGVAAVMGAGYLAMKFMGGGAAPAPAEGHGAAAPAAPAAT